MRDLLRNGPWVILFFISLATLIYVAIRSADIAYFFKYYLNKENGMGQFMAIGTVFVLLGVLPTKWLSKKMGKKKLYIICMLLITVSSMVFLFVGPGDMVLIYAAQIVFSIASGPTMPLLWTMLADTADYSQWKNGRRATGLVYSAATFAQKAGFGLGGVIVMGVLSMLGFVANQQQSPSSIMGIRLSMSVIPAAVALVGAILLFFYKLDDKLVLQIEKELGERNKQTSETN
ncbi:MAG: hypothetical protein HC896_11340 [Bacteroidales bacterium]|nr:hypothetical protein [Bacteroidales bacterium]